MLQRLVIFIIPLCAGIALGSQAPINAALAQHVGPVRASFVSVCLSLLTLSIIVAIDRQGGTLANIVVAPRWSLVGGLMGAIVLVGTVVSVPRLGTATTIALLVTAQLTTAAVVDQFGLLGVAQRSVDAPRLLGVALLIAGGFLVVRR